MPLPTVFDVEELATHVGRETGIDFGTYLAEAVIEPLRLTGTEPARVVTTASRAVRQRRGR